VPGRVAVEEPRSRVVGEVRDHEPAQSREDCSVAADGVIPVELAEISGRIIWRGCAARR